MILVAVLYSMYLPRVGRFRRNLPRKPGICPRRASWLCRYGLVGVLGAGALSGSFGCQAGRPETFTFAGTNLVWPSPPDPPRIRYIGEITGEASLGRNKSVGEVLGELVQGPRPPIRLSTPVSVAVEGNRVWIADPGHPGGPCIHVLDLNARIWSQLRAGGGVVLRWPIDVAIRNGRLAIADAQAGVVFVQGDSVHTFRAIGGGRLVRPASVAWDESGIWVLDAGAHGIVCLDESGRESRRFGTRGVEPGAFNFPAALCLARGAAGERLLAVADAMNFRVQWIDESGEARGVFGKKGDAAGDFSLPRDVAVDSQGHVYVLDNQFENVQVFDRTGRLLMALGQGGRAAGQFNLPAGITIDASDRIWIADTYNRRVQVFEYLAEPR